MILNNLKIILSANGYKLLLIILFALFLVVYSFSWSFILISNFYVRSDLITPLNVFFLLTISALSSLVLVVSIYNLRLQMALHKKSFGFLSIIPAFFTSACPSCAPLILSFTGTTFGIGISLGPFGDLIKTVTIFLLLGIIYYNLRKFNKCKIKIEKKTV